MLSTIGYSTADFLVRVLPEPASDGLARATARIAFALHPPARAELEANLARLLAPSPAPRATAVSALTHRAQRQAIAAHARQSFEGFALSIADFMRLARASRETVQSAVELRGADHLESARASGRGVIVLSAHAGNWEWGAAYLATRIARLHLIARPHPSRWVEAFFARRRERFSVSRLAEHPLWPAASRALRRGEWIALMGDRAGERDLGHSSQRGSICGWVASLARRTGSLVLPALTLRLGRGRYAACFEPPMTPESCRRGDLLAAIRRRLASHPDQWFAFEPMPEGSA